MSELFTLAIWTSTSEKYAIQIVQNLFINRNIPLLFAWYNPKCVRTEDHVLSKPLQMVWNDYPTYSDKNTVCVMSLCFTFFNYCVLI